MKSIFELYTAHKSPVSKEGKRVAALSANELFAEHEEKKKKKKSKMGNRPTVIDKIWFQSTGEGNYYVELKDRLLRGEFKEFKRQLPIEFHVNGVRVGKYIADFAVLHFNGSIDVIDYKGRFTAGLALYDMKKQLTLALYGVAIKEVGVKTV